MKSLVLAVVGLVALMGSAQAAAPAEEAAVRAITTTWWKAFNAYDAATIVALYTDDAILLPADAAEAHGKPAIGTYFAKDIADAKAAGLVLAPGASKSDVGVAGNVAWESGTYRVSAKGAAVTNGKFLSVYHKVNGKWMLFRDTWNDDAPAKK